MPEHDFDQLFNFQGPRVSWNKALTALDYRNYRWRYFYLDNPPKDKEKPALQTDQGHIARKNYSEVQELIKDLAKNVKQYQTQNRDELKRITRAYLEQKKAEAEIRETHLFNELVGISFHLSEKVYTDMINRSKQKLKASSGGNNSLETMTTPEFWTRLANGLLDIANGQISNASAQNFSSAREAKQMALAYVLVSREFAEELRVDHNQGIFSRHLALKDSVYNDDISGFKVSENSLKVLGEDVFNKVITDKDLFQMMNEGNNTEFVFSDFNNMGRQLTSELSQIAIGALQIYFDVDPSNKNNKDYFKTLKSNKKNVQSSSVSRTVRTKISEAIDNFIDQQNWSTEQKNYFGQHFSYRFVNSRNQVYFEAMSIKYNKKTVLYEKQIETIEHLRMRAMNTKSGDFKTYLKNSRSAERELVSNLLETLIDSIEKFGKKKLETLDLQSLGQLNIKDYVENCCKVKGQQYFKDKRDFYSQVVEQLKGDAKTYFANDDYVKYLWKSFRASNSNTYISGFLGEMGGLYQTQNLLKTEGLWTGGNNVYGSGVGTNRRTNYGDSVNDLRFFSQELKQNIGVNIKHYTETNTDEMTLYPGKTDEGISIFKNTMRKYINVEDLNLMRFVLENSYYFQEDTKLMYNIEERLLAHHIPEFYRVKDHARGTSENMFFLINNAFYPLTFIYDRVLDKLDNLLDKESDDALIQTTFKTSQPVKSDHYKDLETARKDWREADWRLGDKRHGKYDMFVRTTGLNINLVKLNLF